MKKVAFLHWLKKWYINNPKHTDLRTYLKFESPECIGQYNPQSNHQQYIVYVHMFGDYTRNQSYLNHVDR